MKALLRMLLGGGASALVSRHWAAVEKTLRASYPEVTEETLTVARAACVRLLDHVL
jgi:hypothetical protein